MSALSACFLTSGTAVLFPNRPSALSAWVGRKGFLTCFTLVSLVWGVYCITSWHGLLDDWRRDVYFLVTIHDTPKL
jgi:hypothetical protein